jgi:hypothetical protein
LLLRFFSVLGVRFPEGAEEHIKLYYQPIFKLLEPGNRGRMIQMFVDKKFINTLAYNAEVFGFPLSLELLTNTPTTHPLPLITMLRDDPIYCESKLKRNRNQFTNQTNAERKGLFSYHNRIKYFDMIEARVFLDPEIMVHINSYNLKEPSANYYAALHQQLRDDLALWIEQNPALIDAHFVERPPLCKLFDYVSFGEHGVHEPKHVPEPEPDYSMHVLAKKLGKKPTIFDAINERQYHVAEKLFKRWAVKKEGELINLGEFSALIHKGDSTAVQWLLEKDYFRAEIVYFVAKLLSKAADWPRLSWFLEIVSPNLAYADGDTVLHRLLKESDYVAASGLIGQGADLDIADCHGQTARFLCEQSDHEEFKDWFNGFVEGNNLP